MSDTLLGQNGLFDPLRIQQPDPGQVSLADAWTANTKALGDEIARQRQISADQGLWGPNGITPAGARDAGMQMGHGLALASTAPEAKIAPMDPISHMLDAVSQSPKARWGLRITDEPIEVGTTLPPSRVWDDSKPTNQTLDGTSVVGIVGNNRAGIEKALAQAGIAPFGKPWNYYPGQHVTLVRGDTWKPGYDDLEHIIPNANAIASYQKADDGPSALQPLPNTIPAAMGGSQPSQ
jgi:hypothetical protein